MERRGIPFNFSLGQTEDTNKADRNWKKKSCIFVKYWEWIYIYMFTAPPLQDVHFVLNTKHSPHLAHEAKCVMYFVIWRTKGLWISVPQWPQWRFNSPATRLFIQSLFGLISKKMPNPTLLALCEDQPPWWFPSQRASNAKSVSVSWPHHSSS